MEIILQATGMGVLTVTLKMGMAQAMKGMEVQVGVVTGMEAEGQHGMREKATGTGKVLMTVLGG